MMDKSESTLQELMKLGIDHEVFNNGKHVRIYANGKEIDLWPSTGTWKIRTKGGYSPDKHKTGLKGILKYLNGSGKASLTEEIAEYHRQYPENDALSPENVLHFKNWLITEIRNDIHD